ncbi:hypothetical protein ACFL13_02340 [Patescibacteria group bacterium]
MSKNFWRFLMTFLVLIVLALGAVVFRLHGFENNTESKISDLEGEIAILNRELSEFTSYIGTLNVVTYGFVATDLSNLKGEVLDHQTAISEVQSAVLEQGDTLEIHESALRGRLYVDRLTPFGEDVAYMEAILGWKANTYHCSNKPDWLVGEYEGYVYRGYSYKEDSCVQDRQNMWMPLIGGPDMENWNTGKYLLWIFDESGKMMDPEAYDIWWPNMWLMTYDFGEPLGTEYQAFYYHEGNVSQAEKDKLYQILGLNSEEVVISIYPLTDFEFRLLAETFGR